MKTQNELILPDEVLMSKIYLIRGQKVMLDRDLAQLYGVETKRLKEQVKRNIERFPPDFMFELTKEEQDSLRSQFATLKRGTHSKYLSYAFTDYGVLMLSSVLNSEAAIQVNIQIMRIYTKLREMLLTHKDILIKLGEFEKRIGLHDKSIKHLFDYLNQFINEQQKPRELIGFRKEGK